MSITRLQPLAPEGRQRTVFTLVVDRVSQLVIARLAVWYQRVKASALDALSRLLAVVFWAARDTAAPMIFS